MFKVIQKAMCVCLALLSLSSCEEQLVQRRQSTVGGKTIGGGGNDPGDFKINNGESYAFPKVTYKEFIPEYDQFAYFKSRTWRIEWPWYDDDFDFNLIPGVLSVSSGELNSFNFLNNGEPETTFNTTLSLFYGDRVEGTRNMWDELDYTFGTPGYEVMETVHFIKGNVSLKTLQDWVQKRPSNFEHQWPESTTSEVMEYQEGDFIHLWLASSNVYGGIRIVSMSPRIVEVYLAVPNP